MKKKPINSVSLWFRGSISAFSKSSNIYNYFHITPDPELAVFFAGKGFIHAFTVNPGVRRFKLAYKNLAEKLGYPKIAARMLSARTDLMTFMDQDLAAFEGEFRKARSVNDLRTALEEFMHDTGIDEDMGKNAAQFSDADIKEFRKWLDGVYGRAGKSGASSLVSVVIEDLQSAGYAMLDLDEEESIVWNSDVLSLIASIPAPEFKMKLRALARNGLPVELFRFKKLFPLENEIDLSKQNKSGKKETFMKKQYTRKQIQEAIAYWQQQLDEGLLSGGSPVKKFMKELQAAVQKPQSVLIGASKKNGKTYTVSDFEYKEGSLTFFADDTKLYGDKQLEANEFIEKLTAEGVKAKQVDGLRVRFPNGVYDVSGVTVMETTSKVYGRGVIIILDVNVSETNSAAINSFFN